MRVKNTLLLILIILIIILSIFKLKKINPPQKKNLILSVIKNYSWETIEPFFLSLKKANFESCEYVIFVNGLSNETIKNIQSLGVKTIEIPKKYRDMVIINIRYKLYEEYLSNNIGKYNIILHVDVRDSFFQKDLFALYKNNKKPFIGVSLEDGILTEKYNKHWILNRYGKNIYNIIKNETIICGGTLWGTADKFLELVRNIWEEINLKSSLKNKILDQCAINYIIYYKHMFKDVLIKNDINHGPVMTVGLAKKKNFFFDSERNLLTFNGEKAALIHQYDRVPSIVEMVKNRFSFQTNKSNILINEYSKIKRKDILFYIFIILVSMIIIIKLVFLRLILKKVQKKNNII